MHRHLIFVIIIALASVVACAQSVWDRAHLDRVKAQLDRPMYAAAYRALIADADSLLGCEPLTVMMKERPAPSGNNHDYTSLARYFHPDPTKPDGLPYMERDGITNPEIALYDRTRLGQTASRIATLALYVGEDDAARYRYAADTMLAALTDGYTLAPDEKEGFILDHSTGHLPAGSEIDVPLVYADYYYLEALMRKRGIFNFRKQ